VESVGAYETLRVGFLRWLCCNGWVSPCDHIILHISESGEAFSGSAFISSSARIYGHLPGQTNTLLCFQFHASALFFLYARAPCIRILAYPSRQTLISRPQS